MAVSMKVNTKMIKSMDMGFIYGQIKENTKGGGSKESSMG